VLLAAIGMEGFSFRTAIREANHTRGKQGWVSYIRTAKAPELPVVLLEDFGALIGLVLALFGVSMTLVTHDGRWDAVGSAAIGLLLVAMGSLFGTLILLPIHLQNVRGLTTLQTGLVLLPGGLAMGLVSPLVGRLSDRFGPRPLVIPGAALLAVAPVVMSMLDENTPIALAVAAHVLTSLGIGLAMTPLMASALGSLEADLYSHGSAILSTLQQLAGAAGTALFITVMTRSAVSGTASGLAPVDAQAAGIQDAFWWGAGLGLVGFALSFLVRRPAEEPHRSAEPPAKELTAVH